MPPKRPLADVDANLGGAPIAKKGKSSAKETGKPHLSSKDTFSQPAPAAPVAADAPPIGEESTVIANAHDHTWICICPLKQSSGGFLDSDSADEEEENEEEQKCGCGQAGKCVAKQPASANPGHRWVVTKKGYELAQEWAQQQEKRDQDNFNMHIFNKWNGYGISEVIENILLAIQKAAKKPYNARKIVDQSSGVLGVWSYVESMALFLNGDIMEMHGIEREDNAKRVMLIGSMLLKTFWVLERVDLLQDNEHKFFREESSMLPNLGLVLSLFLRFAEDFKESCRLNEDGWKYIVVEKADEHGVDISSFSGMAPIVERIREEHAAAGKPAETEIETCPTRRLRGVFDDLTHWAECYQLNQTSGVITLESLNRGTRRSWSSHEFFLEGDAYKNNLAIKVGPDGPEYRDKIGGKFYDLTAQRNKGSHMRAFRL